MTGILAEHTEQAEHTEHTTDPREALGERLLGSMLGAMELSTIELGRQLGCYAVLRGRACTPAELARAAGFDERYAREWVEQQAVAGLLDVDDERGDPQQRRYRLPEAHAEVLLDEASPYYFGVAGQLTASMTDVLPRLLDAYRTGGGVPYADYGAALRDGIGSMNRPLFDHELASTWLPAVPELHDRLRSAPAARVLDVGCGVGYSSIALARGYPLATVHGVDLDPSSVERARQHAAEAGVADRVTFARADAAALDTGDGYDVVTIFESLHDMGDPVGGLRAARRALAPGGSVLLADERAAEAFTAPGDELERLLYGFSVLHCLPATRGDDHVVAHGTVLRAPTVRRWAQQAGFAAVDVLAIDNPFWRFYRLRP